MRVHFMHRHVQDTVIILEEFNLYHPQCPRCDTLVPWKDLNSRNVTNSQCAKGVEQEISWMTAEEIRESAASVFQVYGRSIEIVTSFKDLGWIMTASDYDFPEVVGNLCKSHKSWARLAMILIGRGSAQYV